MSESAKVGSIDALKHFRFALIKFAEAANSALSDADGDLVRTMNWLDLEQQTYWTGQIRKRSEFVARCKEAVRMKKLYKDSTGRTHSAVDEEKALQVAQRQLVEAEQKLVATKQYSRRLQKETNIYKGAVQRFATSLSAEVPAAVAHLNNLVIKLEEYAAADAGGGVDLAAMMRDVLSITDPGAMSRGKDGDHKKMAPAAQADNTPEATVRAAAPPVEAPVAWTAGALLDEDRSRIRILSNDQQPPTALSLVLAPGVETAGRLYFHHAPPSRDDDSGWYIGVADTATMGVEGHRRVTLDGLLAVRPAWAEILALPEAFLVVVDADAITAVVGPDAADLWSTPPAPTADKPPDTPASLQ